MSSVPAHTSSSMRVAAISFCAALLIVGIARIVAPFDGLYGQDAYAYFRFARAVWPHLRLGAPLPVLMWPRGYPIVTALWLPLTGGQPAAGQIVSALSCAWSAAATALIVQALDSKRGNDRPGGISSALAAGLCVACSGGVLRYGLLVMADALTMAMVATVMLCAVRHARGGRGHWLVVGAVALAWGAATRWLAGLLVFPVAAYLALQWRRAAERDRGARARWPWVVAALLAGVCVLLPHLIAAHAAPGSLEKHEWLLAWNPRNILRREFHTPEGYARYRFPVGVFYLLRLGWPDYFFPGLAVLVVAGGWDVVRQRSVADAILLLGWPAAAWLFVSSIPYENPRFLLPTLPAIGALAGIGVSAIDASRLRGRRWIPSALMFVSLVAGLAAGGREHARLVAGKNFDLRLIEWTLARVPDDAELVMAGPTLAFEYYGGRHPRALFDLSATELDDLVAGNRRVFVLADVSNLESQWKGKGPELHVARLRRAPGLTLVGNYPPYSLFAVGENAR